MTIILMLTIPLVMTTAENEVCSKMIDTDLISVKLPDNVTYTLIVVLAAHFLKLIFDVVYRLRKMECKWGSLCFCKTKFKEDDGDSSGSKFKCPECSPSVNVHVGHGTYRGDPEPDLGRNSRLRRIIVD